MIEAQSPQYGYPGFAENSGLRIAADDGSPSESQPYASMGSAVLLVCALFLTTCASTASAADKIIYGTNWLAQAEHGGFYQAVADGTYQKFGLDVTIREGGPQVANRPLLLAGKIDFSMGDSTVGFDSVKQGAPAVTVAAFFQKEPIALMAHPDQGIEKFSDLAKLPTIFMGTEGFISYFSWMKSLNVGFNDNQDKPYTFNPAPFLADKRSAQQGYVTSEPYEIEKQSGMKPKIFLLSDEGYKPYGTTIDTMRDTIDHHPDLVQRFVDASTIGWYHYLYGDNKAANELIKKDNPEMTDGQLAFSLAEMKARGILVSGAAEKSGIGCITDEQMKNIFDIEAKINMFDQTLDYKKSYTTRFVCKGVGMDLMK